MQIGNNEMKNKFWLTAVFAFLILFSFNALSHARLSDKSDVTPRGPAMKDSPCGENARTSNPKILNAGSQITIRWIETVEHTGFYWIEFSKANDKGWVRLKTIIDTQNDLATLPHSFEETITVPNTNCSNCTLRVVQEMIDGHPELPTYYYSCGDIKIVNAKC